MKNKKAFTLIELLVVIAIIALLLAILMPSLKKVKQIARDVVCRSNQKQWGLIWGMYCDENDDKFPCDDPGTGYIRGEWINALRSEWQTREKIVLCPSAPKHDKISGDQGSTTQAYLMGNTNTGEFTGTKEMCSYGMNCWAYSKKDGLPGNESDFWKRRSVVSGNTVPLFMDSMWRGAVPAYTGADGTAPPSVIDEWTGYNGGLKHFALPRHGSGAKSGINVLFFDLSVSHVKIKHVWKLKWHRNFDTRGYTEVTGGTWPLWMDKFSD